MNRIITAAVLALAVTACAPRRDATNWGAVAVGVGHVLSADPAASSGAGRSTEPIRK